MKAKERIVATHNRIHLALTMSLAESAAEARAAFGIRFIMGQLLRSTARRIAKFAVAESAVLSC